MLPIVWAPLVVNTAASLHNEEKTQWSLLFWQNYNILYHRDSLWWGRPLLQSASKLIYTSCLRVHFMSWMTLLFLTLSLSLKRPPPRGDGANRFIQKGQKRWNWSSWVLKDPPPPRGDGANRFIQLGQKRWNWSSWVLKRSMCQQLCRWL